MPLRQDCHRVSVYNEGLIVYLHDPANAGAILQANPPSIFSSEPIDPKKDKKLKAAAEAGLLVVYALFQDDPIEVDVTVGPVLSKAEIKAAGVPLMKPQQTFISVPSGVLRFDTANTWELGGESIDEEPGLVQVPPGDYVMTLYRLDSAAFEGSEDDGAASDTIVLTPITQAEPLKKIPAIIEYGADYGKIAGLRKWKVEGGKFHGIGLGGGLTNFQPKAAAQLGLRRGQIIQVEHEGSTHRAVYLAGADSLTRKSLFDRLYPDQLTGLRSKEAGLLKASFFQSSSFPVWLLNLGSLRPGTTLTGTRGSTVVITPTDEIILPEEGPQHTPPIFDQGSVVGTVLAAGSNGLDLACSLSCLKQIVKGKSGALRLEVQGQTVPVVLCPDFELTFRPHHIVAMLDRQEAELLRDIKSLVPNCMDPVFRAMIGSRVEDLIAHVKAGSGDALVLEIFREGVGRFSKAHAMGAAYRPHWDEPSLGTLALEPIDWPPSSPLTGVQGAEFRLSVLPG